MSDLLTEQQVETPVTSAPQVLAACYKRWPSTEYLTIEEAPEDSARAGRKIDLLVLSCWPSRGFQIDAVEVKVSMSDWKRELADPHKGDFWWRHAHRFWLAVPETLAPKVQPDLPSTWGLLAASAKGVRDVVKAPRHEPEKLSWSSTIGIMRALSGASFGAYNRGRDDGYKQGLAQLERRTGDAQLRAENEKLVARIEKFQKASGLTLDEWSLGDIGHAARVVNECGSDYVFGAAERLRDSLTQLLGARLK